ncbi:MAG: ATP-binding cassette domain-containing protein, partial [Sinobacterium sp.]|nr:ATP-binding cassette domain-containing protein [Sinobacterium sp.]
LRQLIKLEKPSSGKVTHASNLSFGYMPQKLHLNELMPLTVESFLQLGKKQLKRTLSKDARHKLMSELGIENLLSSSMHTLSGGEHQRVMLSRAVLQAPDVLVLDEPAQGVDLAGQNRLYELIIRLRDVHPCAVLMVSHDLHLVMAKTDRVICLNQHICCEGHPNTVSSDDQFTRLFDDHELAAMRHYTHHHDHHHDLHGSVVEGEHSTGCNHDH